MSKFLLYAPAPCALANLALWLWLIYVCRRSLAQFFKGLGTRSWLFLAGLLAAQAAFHVFLVGPKHIVCIDEFWYMEAAKNLFTKGWAPGYSKSIGWPVLEALAFLAGGINNFSAIYLSIALGILAPVFLFFAALAAGLGKREAALASLFLAFLPFKLVWAASAETAAAALFFVCAAFLFSLLYYRENSKELLWLSLVSWAMAAQIRPENIVFLAVFAAGLVIFSRRKTPVLPWVSAIALNAANLAVFAKFQSATNWVAADSGGKFSGANLGLSNLAFNTAHWAPKFLDGSLYPFIFEAAVLAGAAELWIKKRRLSVFLLISFAALYLFYFSAWLQIYGTSQDVFAKTKIFLLFQPVLALFAAYGFSLPEIVKFRAGRIALNALAAVVLAQFALSGDKFHFRAPARELETIAVSKLEKITPRGCVIVANAPVIINSVNFIKTVSSEDFLADKNFREEILGGCAFYFRDVTESFDVGGFRTVWDRLNGEFELKPWAVFSRDGASVGLYKFAGTKILSPGAPAPGISRQPGISARNSPQTKK